MISHADIANSSCWLKNRAANLTRAQMPQPICGKAATGLRIGDGFLRTSLVLARRYQITAA